MVRIEATSLGVSFLISSRGIDSTQGGPTTRKAAVVKLLSFASCASSASGSIGTLGGAAAAWAGGGLPPGPSTAAGTAAGATAATVVACGTDIVDANNVFENCAHSLAVFPTCPTPNCQNINRFPMS